MNAAMRAPAPANRTSLEDMVDPRVGYGGTLDQILAATEERRVTTVMEQARIGFRSGYLPKHIANVDQAIAIAIAGHELGIPPMTAFRVIYFFDNRVVLASQLLVALAHKRVEGFRLDILKATEAGCWVRAWRPGMTEPAPFYFTIQDAQRANLTSKDNWKKYPAAMCIARASAMAIRAIAPEAMLGVMAREEAEDGVRYEVDLGPNGLEVTPQTGPQHASAPAIAPPQAPPAVEGLKENLRARNGGGAKQSKAEKEAARAAPPAGFAESDPSAPPPGFERPKPDPKPEPAKDAKATTAKGEPAPASAPAATGPLAALRAELAKVERETASVDAWWADNINAIESLAEQDFRALQAAAADHIEGK